MRFDTTQHAFAYLTRPAVDELDLAAIIISPIEGEELVSMRSRPGNAEMLLSPMVAGELAVALLDAVIAGGSDAEAATVRDTMLGALAGDRPEPMFVDYDFAAAVRRAALTAERRQLEDAGHGRRERQRDISFDPVAHGINGIYGNAHLMRMRVATSAGSVRPPPNHDICHCHVVLEAINRGGGRPLVFRLNPALAYDVAGGLLATWRSYAPEVSIVEMSYRLTTLCLAKADLSPVAKVKSFYGTHHQAGRGTAADPDERPAANGDDLLDELAASPRR